MSPPLRRNRDFVLLWSGQAAAALGGNVAAVAYPFLALLATGSATGAGLVAFAGLATATLLRLPGGVLADRWPLRPLLVWSETVRALVTGTLVAGVLLDRLTLVHLLVATVVGAACGVCAEPAQTVAVRHVVPAEQLPHALAQNEARGHVAGLGGQPLGGWLYGLGPVLPVAAHAVSSVLGAVTVALIRRPLGSGDHDGAPMGEDILTGLRYLWRHAFLRATLVLAAAFQFVFAGLGLLIVAAAAAAGTPAVHVGTALAIGGAGGLFGAWAAPVVQRRVPTGALIVAFGWTSAACLALMAVLPNIYVTGALLAAVYFVATPANATLMATQMGVTPPHLQGRVISAAMLVAGCVAPLGPLAAGALFDRVGRPATFAVFAAVAAVTASTMRAGRLAGSSAGRRPPGVLRGSRPAAYGRSMTELDLVRRYRRAEGWRGLSEFAGLLALDNQTHDIVALRRNAAAVADLFTARGATMEVVELDGAAPLVIGQLGTDPRRPTIGVYVHYDGQPAGPAGWSSPPFEPTLRAADGGTVPLPGAGDLVDDDWRLFARGSADDKAPLAALLIAVDALRAAGVEQAVNLVFCFEGEEESGSPHLRDYLERYRDRLPADAWLICDGPVHHTGAPQVVLGVRGYCGVELTVYGPAREIHSGHYGNWAPNPALRLAQLLASCKDAAGTVTIDGFYDTTRPPSAAETAALAGLPPVEEALLGQLGLAAAEVPGSRLVDRLMWPSFNVRGLASADVGAGARNVVPATATASIDIRLAAGNDAAHMIGLVRAHLERQGHHVLDREPTDDERRAHPLLVRLDGEIGYPAMRTPPDEPIVAHLAAVASAAAGRDALVMPTLGGSVPLFHLAEVLRSPTVVLPIANHDNNQHAADENLRLGNLWYGVDLFAQLLLTEPPR